MEVGWLVDTQAFESYCDELIDAISCCGYEVVAARRPPPPYQWDDVDCSYRRSFPAGSCVVTHGDLDLVQRVAADQLWEPGVFASIRNYFCSRYYGHFGDFLLNNQYMMLPFNEIPRMADFVFDTLGREGEIFLRPDSPLKTFTGQTVSKRDFDKDYDYIGFNDFPRESLVIASSPQEIIKEWRFVVVESSVVAGTEYHNGVEFVAEPVKDLQAQQFAKMIAARNYQPDPVWVLDVCKTKEGDYSIVEIGGFSFASLYGCNKVDVVRAVSEVAKRICVTSSERDTAG